MSALKNTLAFLLFLNLQVLVYGIYAVDLNRSYSVSKPHGHVQHGYQPPHHEPHHQPHHQPHYESHHEPHHQVYVEVVTSTKYWTETRVHTVRLTSTNDVQVTVNSVQHHTVTQFTTERDFVQGEPRTVVSTLWVTKTPVFVNTVSVGQNSNRNLFAETTRYVTETQTAQRWSTLTHVQVENQVRTVPEYITETLTQRRLDTTTQFITVTVTSTTREY